jgi:DNA-binding HxlR family transcriptional regulator
MLSDRLTELGDAGLVTRTVGEGPPVSVSYALTKAGALSCPRSNRSAGGPRSTFDRSGDGLG